MLVRQPVGARSLKDHVSEGEWMARVDLAALYRLVALHHWDDMIFTHISARVPGEERHFLINPFGMFFEEATASSLVKIDLNGKVLQDTPHEINEAGFTIHSAIHAARDDAHYVIHLHTLAGIAVSTHVEGLMPLTQHALIAIPQLAYHDYEGIALNLDERERLIGDLGDKTMLMLRNHGTLAVGANAAEAWIRIYFLEAACARQVMALSAGREHVRFAPDAAREEVRQQTSHGLRPDGKRAWPGCLRRLAREAPGYDV